MRYSHELEQGLQNLGLPVPAGPSNGWVDGTVQRYGTLQHPEVRIAGLEVLLLDTITNARDQFQKMRQAALSQVHNLDQLTARVEAVERQVETAALDDLAEAWSGRMSQLDQVGHLLERLDRLERENQALKQRWEQHLVEHRAPRARADQTLELMEAKVDFVERLEALLVRVSPEDAEDLKQEALQKFNGQNGRNGGGYLDLPGRPKG